MHRIALIHATPVAIAPVEHAFRDLWPEVDRFNLLDDSLSGDRECAGDLTPELRARIGTLADYALTAGADAILFTCSAFGPAIERVAERLPMPVLKPNQAMFERALEAGDRIGMLATFGPSVASMTAEFDALASKLGRPAHLETRLVEGAMAALRSGDGAEHDRLIGALAQELSDCDAILLAHFSTARARAAVEAGIDCPVLSSPESAVRALQRAMAAGPRP